MTTISEIVRAQWDNGLRNEDQAAAAAAAMLLASPNKEELLFTLMRGEVASTYRRYRLAMEKAVPELNGKNGSKWFNPATAERELLLKESVYVPGEGRVTWGQLTIRQHRAVTRHYQIAIAGYAATVARHESAIAIIQSYPGAECLDECTEVPVPTG